MVDLKAKWTLGAFEQGIQKCNFHKSLLNKCNAKDAFQYSNHALK
jgi:hypothetical protein